MVEAEHDATERLGAMPGLERALSTLAVESRAVLWLHDVEGYTHKEIGQLMGKTSSYSKSQLARAYQRLLRMLDPQTTADGPAIKADRVLGTGTVTADAKPATGANPTNHREVHERCRTGKDIKAPCPS